MDIGCGEFQNFNIIESDDEDDAEFSIINPDLVDLDLEDGYGVSNTPVASTMIDSLLLPNQQFYELCS